MMYRRRQYDILKTRIAEPRRFIQVVAGPRQVGKSTLVSQVLDDIAIPHQMFNADNVSEENTDWISQCWMTARSTMQIKHLDEYILVIDEIQKINNWSEAVKREWDADNMAGLNLKVILLGSSRLMLRKGLTESLAGRFEMIRLGHWSYMEMKSAFGWNLDQWIYFGGYPGSASLTGDERRWRRYIKDSLVNPAIEKDVIMTSRIYKPALMSQLFQLSCSYSGELLSLTKMLGQLQDAGNVTTIQAYINILDQCNLLTGLQKYANDTARKYQSVPKYQVYNNALLTAYHRTSYEKLRVDPKQWGRWVESAVGTHLVSNAEEHDYEVYYWRERSDEVDFIIDMDGDITAVEVKSGRRGMNRGLPLFQSKFSPKHSYVIGTDGLSLEDFFSADILDLIN